MQVETTPLAGVLLLTPDVFGDARGYFLESWNLRRFAAAVGIEDQSLPPFVQDNQSRSCRGVLRGLHYQVEPEPQAKLVRCMAGEIFDVAVDLRRDSATFGQWTGAVLSGTNHRQLWVPVGFAHGFLTLSDSADVLYKTAGFWNRSCERAIRWDDPELAIDWPTDGLDGTQPLLTSKDAEAPTLAEALAAGSVFAGEPA
jgi:dTDP-4-dehydrorhamnose 3,5-epimerase